MKTIGKLLMRQRRRKLEILETRRLLDGHGVLWGVDAGLSISFAPDGTSVGPETSTLFSTFESLGSESEWQEAILRGFQTWARHTNADIGVVSDDGSDFGVAGSTAGDPRFGDIRISAIPMDSDFFATSIPTDEFVDGTWVGDVFFNSNAEIDTLDELFAVALHEAGHVFGLDHNEDSASPLFRHDLPESTTLTAADVAALQEIYGVRRPDIYEEEGGDGAAKIEMKVEDDGSTPGVVFGDLQTSDDVDLYKFEVKHKETDEPDEDEREDDDEELPEEETDSQSVVIRLITDEVSLLQARVTVETEDGEVLGTSRAGGPFGNSIQMPLPDEEKLYLRVTSIGIKPYDVGGYSLTVEYPETNLIAEEDLLEIAKSRVRALEQGDVKRRFEALTNASSDDDDDEAYLDEDMGVDDIEGNEIELAEDASVTAGTRFVTRNALSIAGDIDRHRITVPESIHSTMTLQLSSLSPGLRTQVIVTDALGNAVPTNWLIHGEGTNILQLIDVNEGEVLKFQVSAHHASANDTGNYEMMVRFEDDPVGRTPKATGLISNTATQVEHRVQVNRLQLFQFGVDRSHSAEGSQLTVQIADELGAVLDEFQSYASELGTHTTLLSPGEYRVIISTMGGALPASDAPYSLLVNALDIPLGIEPVDPTEDPYCGYDFIGLFQCILILGDINGDGLVDFTDFLELAENFGKENATREEGDLDGDETVGFGDFLILARNFGHQNPEEGVG